MSNLEFARAQARDSKIKLHGADAFAGMAKAGQLVAEALDLLVDAGEARRDYRCARCNSCSISR